jgi:tetratricopeptide (TPR) repeat protein
LTTGKLYYRLIIVITVIIITVVLPSCSTKKNSFTRRVYHNLTGHYNMFWNGRESYRDGVRQLNNTVKDNYTEVLRVYNYGTEAEAQSLNPYMDKAIEKAALNIQRHSMFFNRKEYVRWIDDSYFLIGQSYFYKQDYNRARRTFEFISNEYKKNPIRYDALLWMGNSYLQQKQYKRAETALDNLKNEINKNPDVSQNVQKAFPLVRADLYIKQKKYGTAKEHLQEALYLKQKKNTEARVRFILGQIYQSEDELYKASEYFSQVIKLNPAYEMAFNATISLAQCYDTRYGMDSKSIVRNLNKMLKEDKNKDYRDQIYFALADIASKDGMDTTAIHYLKLSVAVSKTNNYQKVSSALKLGNIYFDLTHYKLAQAYYDTAIQVMPKDYPDYDKIKDRTAYLTDLVINLIVVETEDSLQRLVAMSEEDRNKIIDKIISDLIEQEEKQKELEELQLALGQTGQGGAPLTGGPTGSGNWYFYNSTAIAYGLSEFKKKWGNRKYEENWRLSNKQAVFEPKEIELTEETDSLMTDSTMVVSNDPHTRNYYLQNLPFTEEQMILSDSLIESALYNLGFIYKDNLEDYQKSIESFDTLLGRFPESKHKLEVLYQLNRLYYKLENFEKAEEYKDLIVEYFPDSDYARLLVDPDYFKELEAQKNLANTLYSETYDHYLAGRYFTVFSNSNRALSEFTGPPDILSKFEYLRALSIGKIEVVDSLKTALENLVAKYPGSEVIPLAQNILDYLTNPGDSITSKEPEETFDVSLYEFNPKSKQLFALVVNDENVNINALKVRISDFNEKFYGLENLSITNILLSSTTHFVMIGNFSTIKDVMNYYNAIMANEYVFANLSKESFSGFAIAQENYPVFYKDKDVKKYLAFFKKNYFGNQ